MIKLNNVSKSIIIISKDNKGKIISDWIKNDNYELYHNHKKIEKDIEIQNLKVGEKLILLNN